MPPTAVPLPGVVGGSQTKDLSKVSDAEFRREMQERMDFTQANFERLARVFPLDGSMLTDVSVDAGKLDPSIMGPWRSIFDASHSVFAQPTGFYFVFNNDGLAVSGSSLTAPVAARALWLDPDDYNIDGMRTEFRIVFGFMRNATAIGASCVVHAGLWKIASAAGAASNTIVNATGNGLAMSCNFTAPAVSTLHQNVSPAEDFTESPLANGDSLPGWFGLSFGVTGANMAAGSGGSSHIQLQMRHVPES